MTNSRLSLAKSVTRLEPTPDNPLATVPHIFTVVTPDMAASLDFYRAVMGYELVRRGALGPTLPFAEAGPIGRDFALLRYPGSQGEERGVLRLLAAPPGVKANRPRPDAKITDPGLALFECHPADPDAAYAHLAAHGVPTISPPHYYFFGPEQRPSNSSTTFSAFGPAGEQINLSCQNVPHALHVRRPVAHGGVTGPFVQHTVMTADRWPLLDFYGAVFGLVQLFDRLVAQESINQLMGAPADTYYRFLWVGGAEFWEFRQWRPPATPRWPTALDRTGFAMVSLLVDDLAVVRSRIAHAGIPVLGEGALPMIEEGHRDAIHIRGPVGELIEIVGRA